MEIDSGVQSSLSAECRKNGVNRMAVGCFLLEDLLDVISSDGLDIR